MKKKRGKRKNPEGLLPWEHFQGPPSYKAAHGGRAPKGERNREVPDPEDNDRLIAMGKLCRIEYETDKGAGKVTYWHDLKRPYPLLCYGSDDGRLYIVGGGYKVTSRGIVG